jgi:putative hydrolase of HD superfamily
MEKRDPGSPEFVEKSLELARMLLSFGRVERVCYHPDGKTYETDAEHTVMLGVMACAFAKEYEPQLDLGKVAQFALVHDLVEVYAGDTMTFRPFSEEEKKEKEDREHAALARIRAEFDADFPWIGETIEEYERRGMPEARFVKFLDKILPKLTHIMNRGVMKRQVGHTKEHTMGMHETQLASIMDSYGKEFPRLADMYRAVAERVLKDCFEQGL